MKTYTIVLATRLKRRVFRAKNIPRDVQGLISEYLDKNGIKISQCKFYDYGFILSIECNDRKQAEKTAAGIRMATSKPIRSLYPELWQMPSLWNSKPLILEGGMSAENIKKAETYYDNLRTRS